jgi:hypothetical protein
LESGAVRCAVPGRRHAGSRRGGPGEATRNGAVCGPPSTCPSKTRRRSLQHYRRDPRPASPRGSRMKRALRTRRRSLEAMEERGRGTGARGAERLRGTGAGERPLSFAPNLATARSAVRACTAEVSRIDGLAPLTWTMIFRDHSFIHTHMNAIVWQMPFTFFGLTLCAVAAGTIGRDLLRAGRGSRRDGESASARCSGPSPGTGPPRPGAESQR